MTSAVALVALSLSLAPGQNADFRLSNPTATNGLWGPPRADDKVVPGDSYFLRFDMENITLDETGRAKYRMDLKVTNEKGERTFRQVPQDEEAFAALGGNTLQGHVTLDVGLKSPAGKYTLTLEVTDLAAKKTASLTRKVEILPLAFALVRPQLSLGANAPVAPLVVAGQDVYVNFEAVGFERDKKSEQPEIDFELSILDDKKKMTTSKPFAGKVKDKVDKANAYVPIRYLLKMNRAGTFTIQVKATDKVANKTATLSLPIRVVSQAGK
jgi:hypothetical protein